MTFNNKDSHCGFIGESNSVEDVIASDTKELKSINGSFEEIADRMDYIIRLANNERKVNLGKMQTKIFKRYGYDTTDILKVPGSITDPQTEAGKVYGDICRLYSETPWFLPGENNVGIVNVISTRGMQFCPFDNCNTPDAGSNAEYKIKNVKTGQEITINEVTSHLARIHHLLEKGNEYGISALEFYKHFML